MFSTVHAGLCILVQIHLSLSFPSCQTQSNQRSLRVPYTHVENPGPPYPRWETHQLCKLLFKSSPRNNLGKWTHRLTWLLVGSSVFFSPCQAQCGPSFSSGEKWGWACCCDITSWFWNTRKKWKTFTKATGQATRHHTATILFSCPATLRLKRSHISTIKRRKQSLSQAVNSGMCHFTNTPLSHWRPLSKRSPLR